jgi:hypothetical protein
MVPEAPIDGTMPSVFPEDRSGDFTFTRGSNLAATRVASNGLIEKGRENLVLQSNQFDTTWATSAASVTSGQSGYDGTNDAWLLKRSDASSRFIFQNLSAGSSVYTFSFYAKPESENWAYVYSFNGSSAITTYFDLQNGVVGATSGPVISTNIQAAGNGYYRCSLTYNTSVSQVRIVTDAGIYIQDAQLEQGLAASPYIPTTTTTAQAGLLENEPRIDFTGGGCGSLLLEPQRTNSVVHSEYFGASNWTALRSSIALSSVTSPEGKANAYKLTTDGTANNTHIIYYGGALTADTYSLSLYAKAAEFNKIGLGTGNLTLSAKFDLSSGSVITSGTHTASIESAGNDWYRCTIVTTTATPIRIVLLDNDGNISFDGDGTSGLYIFGHQQETGSYPTSYIPTYGNIVTRSRDQADNISLNPVLGNGNISVMYDFVYDVVGREGSGQLFLLYSGNNSLGIKGTQPNDRRLQLFSYGDFTGTIGFNEEVPYQTRHKVVFRVTGEVVELFYNGVKQNATISGAALGGVYNWSRIKFDPTNAFLANLNQLAVFPTALTDEECSALTQP